jgi:deazaflavin-dependent oxidoreductase (nitroreductase family)
VKRLGGMDKTSVLRRVLRAPALAYRANAGWVFGHRFLCLTHRGRRSGRLYRTVLEVVEWRPERREAVVISGFGPRAQWFRNVRAGGAAEVEIGRECWLPDARVLDPAEGTAVLAGYERRNRLLRPLIRPVLSKLAGFRYDGSDAARRRVVEALPLVALSPHAGRR